jgi:hypothetical protein
LQLFARGRFAPQLVEEVFEEDYVVLRLLRFHSLDRHQRSDAFVIRGKIIGSLSNSPLKR